MENVIYIYLISHSGTQVTFLGVLSELMPADLISRHLEDFGGVHEERQGRADCSCVARYGA